MAQQSVFASHWPTPKPVPLPVPHDDPAWHTIDYHAAERAPFLPVPHAPNIAKPVTRVSLLDEVGRLQQPVAPEEPSAWKRLLHQPKKLTAEKIARLHLWLGELALARDEQPRQALWHFAQAAKQTKPASGLHGLAAYDTAIALFYEGAYNEAATAFKRLLAAKPAARGFERRTATLFWRHARVCAGYHAERAALGIPEPAKLDPLCGASALALALKAHHKPYDKQTILANMRVTGRGSSMQDVVNGAQKLRLSAHVVHATDKGLIALPKPLVAYVEHDHFVSVSRADEKGVSYLCSDCGPWPGGEVSLTWAQWHKMEATAYAVVSEPGSDIDGALTALAPTNTGAKGVQIASAGRKLAGDVIGRMRWLRLFKKQGIFYPMGGETFSCGFGPLSQQCSCFVCCLLDSLGDSGGGGDHFFADGPSEGDPVNLATGEEEYAPKADLTVYNPVGPSVVWSRRYDSLRGNTGTKGYQSDDFGQCWSHSYNIGMFVTFTNAGQPASCYLMEPNGARIALSASQVPSASVPHVTCGVPSGIPLLAEWDYNSALGKTYFVITHADRTKWILPVSTYGTGFSLNEPSASERRRAFCLTSPQRAQPNVGIPLSATPQWFPIGQVVDRNNNGITFNYGPAGNAGYPLLSSIVDKNNAALLTFNRNNFHLTSVADRYGRSVYYHGATYAQPGSSLWELDHVSQVVLTGASSPPDRYVYGYQYIDNGDNGLQGGGELVAMLHTITVPSPTGTGTATATINYLPSYCTVSSLVDANGNVRSYSQPDQSHTQVTVKDAQGNITYRYTGGYDMNMSGTTLTNGAVNANGGNTQIVSSPTYADPNDPYRPSQTQDGNGNAVGGAGGKGTWTYTWDQFGNCLTSTTPRGTTTTKTYNYQNFALGELTQIQVGGKTPTTISYYEPSGLKRSIQYPLPGTSGSGQTVAFLYNWDTLGNLLKVTQPGNDATQSIVSTFNYTSDGNYTQQAAKGQPVSVIDNFGRTIWHYRYDSRGNEISKVDALGDQTDFTYNIVDQPVQTILPLTAQTGSGRGYLNHYYLYPSGSLMQTVIYDENANAFRQITTAYGAEGETLSATGNREPVAFTYDALYRKKALSDGNSHVTSYSYNTSGYLASVSFPNSSTVQIPTYDLNGHPIQRIDGRGVVTNYIYNDVESCLTDVQYPASPTLNTHKHYDTYGRVDSIVDGVGSYNMSYEDRDKITTTVTTYVGVPAKAITYSYNPTGSLKTLSTPAGDFNYRHDLEDRMVSLTNPFGENYSWTYLDNGWLWKQESGAAIRSVFTYNAVGQVKELVNRKQDMNNTLISDYSGIEYDAMGNRLSTTTNMPSWAQANFTSNYSYDAKNQLLQENNNAYSYDPAGNITNFAGKTFSYNTANQITAATYDGSGNQAIYTSQFSGTNQNYSCTYDAENRLTAFGNVFTSSYLPNSLRASRTANNSTTYFLYTTGQIPICEMNSQGNITAVNTVAHGGLLSRHTASGTVYNSYDIHGNTTNRVDTNGSIISSSCYNAFGTLTTTSSSIDPYDGFGGKWGYYKENSSAPIYLLGHRFYGTEEGRFLNQDPIYYNGGINLYSYTGNNPVTAYDPSGYQASYIDPTTGGPFFNSGFRCIGPANGTGGDSCEELEAKMALIQEMISAHEIYDYMAPGDDPNPDHSVEISQLWNAFNKCEEMYLKKCVFPPPCKVYDPKPIPVDPGNPVDPIPINPWIPVVIVGGVIVCALIPGCIEGVIVTAPIWAR